MNIVSAIHLSSNDFRIPFNQINHENWLAHLKPNALRSVEVTSIVMLRSYVVKNRETGTTGLIRYEPN